MEFEPHTRARLLVDHSLIATASADEQRWLNAHLAGCAECTQYAEVCRRTVQALDSFAIDLDPEAALRVQTVIRSRAARLAVTESHRRNVFIGMGVALCLTISGSAAVWQPVAWLAERWNLPTPLWQIGFVLFWPLPSLVLALLPSFRSRLMDSNSGGKGETI